MGGAKDYARISKRRLNLEAEYKRGVAWPEEEGVCNNLNKRMMVLGVSSDSRVFLAIFNVLWKVCDIPAIVYSTPSEVKKCAIFFSKGAKKLVFFVSIMAS